jgi:hypothetical protein
VGRRRMLIGHGTLTALVGIVLVFVLAGCAGSEEEGKDGSVPSSPEEVNDLVVRVSGAQGTVYSGDYGNLSGEIQQVEETTLGDEPQEYEVQIEEGASDGITAAFRKTEPVAGELKAEIVADGEVVAESRTRVQNGSVIVEWLPEMMLEEEGIFDEDFMFDEEVPPEEEEAP